MKVRQSDVKEEDVDSSSTKAASTEEVDTGKSAQQADESEDSATEEDVDLFSESERSIPYKVFKERNSKLRETERELKKLKSDLDKRVQDELYKKEMDIRREYEAKFGQKEAASKEDYLNLDDYALDTIKADPKLQKLEAYIQKLEEKVTAVSTKTEREEIRRAVDDLTHEYPALDREHVYALKRARPEWSWQECAEYSHEHFSKHLEGKWKEMIEKKKMASKKKLSGSEGLKAMKPEDRPKSFADARKKINDLYGG